MIATNVTERAKRLVEALSAWKHLHEAYQVAQRFLDEEREDAKRETDDKG